MEMLTSSVMKSKNRTLGERLVDKSKIGTGQSVGWVQSSHQFYDQTNRNEEHLRTFF